MKRRILIFLIVFFESIIFAQEVQWIVTEDTQLKLYRNMGYEPISKNSEVSPSNLSSLDTNQITYIYFNGKKGILDADKVIPKNTKELFIPELINSNLIILPYYNFDILQKKDRTIIKEKFNDTFESLKGEWYTEQECYEEVINYSSSKQLSIKNAIVTLSANNEQHCWLFVNTIEKILNGYRCKGQIEYGWEDHIFINSPTKGTHTLLILFDGDFINVYEDSEDKLIMTYAITDEKTLNEFNNLILTGKCNLSNVTWPRHADGTSPYDNQNKPAKFDFESLYANSKTTTVSTPAQSSTNVAANKTMTVYENLKLRSGEATTSSVLTVMQTGTKVKILEIGKAETIDGIDSNWVKVEVQKGSKDRNGKTIKAGTVGWCYGGYLE